MIGSQRDFLQHNLWNWSLMMRQTTSKYIYADWDFQSLIQFHFLQHSQSTVQCSCYQFVCLFVCSALKKFICQTTSWNMSIAIISLCSWYERKKVKRGEATYVIEQSPFHAQINVITGCCFCWHSTLILIYIFFVFKPYLMY